MKKQTITLLLALLIATIAVSATNAEVKASILRYEPAPAEQGNPVDIWVQLQNFGTQADHVALKFIPTYPFSLPTGEDAEIDAGSIAATENKVVKFTVFVDAGAPNGDRNITFQYKFSANNEWTKLETPISIQTQNAVLLIDNYKVTPSPIIPGQSAKVELTLRNPGKIGIKNVDVSLDAGNFSTLGSGAKKRIDYIAAKETETISFQIASDTSTAIKIYNIPVSLSYQDERNKQYSDTAKISLVVNAQPELFVMVDKTDFASKQEPGKVTLKIINKGVVNLKYVNVRLVQTDQYDVLSPSLDSYVGNLDSDDFETTDFTLKPLVLDPHLIVQVDFKDPYNVDFSKQYELPLRIITPEDLGKKNYHVGGIVAVIVVLLAGIYFWRRRKKR